MLTVCKSLDSHLAPIDRNEVRLAALSTAILTISPCQNRGTGCLLGWDEIVLACDLVSGTDGGTFQPTTHGYCNALG